MVSTNRPPLTELCPCQCHVQLHYSCCMHYFWHNRDKYPPSNFTNEWLRTQGHFPGTQRYTSCMYVCTFKVHIIVQA